MPRTQSQSPNCRSAKRVQFAEICDVHDGGDNGSLIGRNIFQRPREQALDMLDKIIGIYRGKM